MTTTKKEKETIATDEAPRGFSVLLQQIDEGALHAELSETIQKISAQLSEHAENFQHDAKGALTLTLSICAHRNGTVSVVGDVKTKTPKAKPAGSLFWLTKGNNLTPENPRQGRLPLREVPAEAARAVPDEQRSTRTI